MGVKKLTMHATLANHSLPDLLLPDHFLLQICSMEFHCHFSVQHCLPVPQHGIGAHLYYTLVVVAFSYYGVVSAIRPQGKIVAVYLQLRLLLTNCHKERNTCQQSEQ
jgi:hypothetical protein